MTNEASLRYARGDVTAMHDRQSRTLLTKPKGSPKCYSEKGLHVSLFLEGGGALPWDIWEVINSLRIRSAERKATYP